MCLLVKTKDFGGFKTKDTRLLFWDFKFQENLPFGIAFRAIKCHEITDET